MRPKSTRYEATRDKWMTYLIKSSGSSVSCGRRSERQSKCCKAWRNQLNPKDGDLDLICDESFKLKSLFSSSAADVSGSCRAPRRTYPLPRTPEDLRHRSACRCCRNKASLWIRHLGLGVKVGVDEELLVVRWIPTWPNRSWPVTSNRVSSWGPVFFEYKFNFNIDVYYFYFNCCRVRNFIFPCVYRYANIAWAGMLLTLAFDRRVAGVYRWPLVA